MGDMSLDNTSHVHQRARAKADFDRPRRDELGFVALPATPQRNKEGGNDGRL